VSELRQDVATRRWSIIATERAKRPDDFNKGKPDPSEKSVPALDESCPFCPGNEGMTPEPSYVLAPEGSRKEGWRVRVVPNKFSALSAPAGDGEATERRRRGMHLEMDGVGQHEVVIEVPDHSKTIATMTDEEVRDVVLTYRRRFLDLDRHDWNQMIIIFRNQGKRAGTSLEHPHSQIIGSPIVPDEIRRRLEEAQRYYDDNGTCVYCNLIRDELKDKARLVTSNPAFVAICPFASTVPYETWILPRRHGSSFGVISEEEAGFLARILRETLSRMYCLLRNPDYNYVVRSAPHHSAGEPHFHWYVEILPRLTTRAGFEIGSGMNINVVTPEDAAGNLREVEWT
jgi:UDPglucose--hexose-1-phosphate uridylyltransferase